MGTAASKIFPHGVTDNRVVIFLLSWEAEVTLHSSKEEKKMEHGKPSGSEKDEFPDCTVEEYTAIAE